MAWYSSKFTPGTVRRTAEGDGWIEWIQSLDFVTQSAHFGWGGFVTLILGLWLPWWAAGGLFLGVWAAPKELLFDWLPFGENHGSPDWIDLLFYTLGASVACLFLWF